MAILKYWKYFTIAALIIAILCGKIYYDGKLTAVTAHEASALAAQQNALSASCDASRAISERVANERQKQIDDLNRRVVADSLREPATCTPVDVPAACSAPVPVGTSGAGRLQHYGITTAFLKGYARRYRLCQINLESCKSFVNGIYEANGVK